MDVELADLEALVVLAETLHFGRAADRLHVSQPALSKRIRRMERECDTGLRSTMATL